MVRRNIIAACLGGLLVPSVVFCGCRKQTSEEAVADTSSAVSNTAETEPTPIEDIRVTAGTIDPDVIDGVVADFAFFQLAEAGEDGVEVPSVLTGSEIVYGLTVLYDTNLYCKPSAGSAVIASVPEGTMLLAYGERDERGFIKVVFRGRICYVQSTAFEAPLVADEATEEAAASATSAASASAGYTQSYADTEYTSAYDESSEDTTESTYAAEEDEMTDSGGEYVYDENEGIDSSFDSYLYTNEE